MAASSALAGMSGDRKSAILVVLLGQEVSGKLLRHLSKRNVARIAREVADLGPIEPGIAQAVLEEYYLGAWNAPRDQGGPEIARHLLAQASIEEEIVDKLIHDTGSPGDVLGPLLEAPPELLARALEDLGGRVSEVLGPVLDGIDFDALVMGALEDGGDEKVLPEEIEREIERRAGMLREIENEWAMHLDGFDLGVRREVTGMVVQTFDSGFCRRLLQTIRVLVAEGHHFRGRALHVGADMRHAVVSKADESGFDPCHDREFLYSV